MDYSDMNGAVPPAGSDTDIKVQVLANDKSTPILGLLEADFWVTIDGGAAPVTGVVEDGNGYYTLSVAVSAGEVVTKLYDTAKLVPAINVSDILFSGEVSAIAV